MKDSNAELTCLSLGLAKALEVLLERGAARPEHLSVKYDNTGREGKNQHVAKYLLLFSYFVVVEDDGADDVVVEVVGVDDDPSCSHCPTLLSL
eukprot:6469801-Amphidinium_carterae.1